MHSSVGTTINATIQKNKCRKNSHVGARLPASPFPLVALVVIESSTIVPYTLTTAIKTHIFVEQKFSLPHCLAASSCYSVGCGCFCIFAICSICNSFLCTHYLFLLVPFLFLFFLVNTWLHSSAMRWLLHFWMLAKNYIVPKSRFFGIPEYTLY